MEWYEHNPELFESEKSYIRRTFPDVTINIEQRRMLIHGPFPVVNENGRTLRTYQLKVVFPRDYPNWTPTVYMKEPGIEYEADRHMMRNGAACFCLPHEIPALLGGSITFQAFHEKLFRYWLLGQVAYDRDGNWPFSAWQHTEEGIIDSYAKITKFSSRQAVITFIRLLARKNAAKGHERCPCGSGLRLRQCHRHLYDHCRDTLPSRARALYHSKFLIQANATGKMG